MKTADINSLTYTLETFFEIAAMTTLRQLYFTFYQLSKLQNVQQKLREEQRGFKDRPISGKIALYSSYVSTCIIIHV